MMQGAAGGGSQAMPAGHTDQPGQVWRTDPARTGENREMGADNSRAAALLSSESSLVMLMTAGAAITAERPISRLDTRPSPHSVGQPRQTAPPHQVAFLSSCSARRYIYTPSCS